MTDTELKRLAKLVAEEMAGQEHQCPLGLDHDTAAQLRDLAKTWQSSRKAMFVTVVGLLVAMLCGIFGLGVVAKIGEVAAKLKGTAQ